MMDSPQDKKGLITKTWERCKSFGGMRRKCSSGPALKRKSKSWSHSLTSSAQDQEKSGKGGRVAPEGCFSIYVGSHKQRFVIKTEYLNHPLFKMLLEEAESEYGYRSDGPLTLPCEVDYFMKVLMEMDPEEDVVNRGCTFGRSISSYNLLTPPRFVALNKF